MACLAVTTTPSATIRLARKIGAGERGRSTDASRASIRILAAWYTLSRTSSDHGASAAIAHASARDTGTALSSSKVVAASNAEFDDSYPPNTNVALAPSIVTRAADS